MKVVLALVAVAALAGCAGEPEATITRGQAIQQVQNEVGVSSVAASNMIDHVCSGFKDGAGGATITNDLDMPREYRESFAQVILIATQSECPEFTWDAVSWLKFNNWG